MRARIPDWKAAAGRGHEIGNHTMTHPCSGNFTWSRDRALEDFTPERMKKEFADADDVILRAVGVTPRTFAYPCGQAFIRRGEATSSYVPLVAEHFLAGRGFRSEFVNSPEYCDLANLGGVDSDAFTLDRYMAWVDRALAEGGWVIFCGHDIGVAAAFQVSVAGELDQLCRRLKEPATGVWIDTVAAVADWIATQRRTTKGK
jgi:hypothetical protein